MLKHVPWIVVIAFALAAGPASAQSNSVDCSINAAYFYWKALALAQSPTTPEEIELAHFQESKYARLAPAVFAARLDALRWLLNEKQALRALDVGCRHPVCAFAIYQPDDPSLDLSHLRPMQALARKTLVTAKAYESVENAEGSAILYADVLRMICHLDQDRNLSSGLAGATLTQNALSELEGFFSRNQKSGALIHLTRYFAKAPARIFHPGDYLRDESQRYSRWLTVDPDTAEKRLGQLYGDSNVRPAMDRLMTLNKEAKAQRIRAWVDEYRYIMGELAKAVDLPYAEGLPRVQELDAKKKMPPEALRVLPSENPLVPLLVPAMEATYEHFLLAEAQFDMMDILSAAALYRGQAGLWPGNLDEISRFIRRPLPKDPFSGEDFYYKLSRGTPILITRVPKRIAADGESLYEVNLSRRLKNDEANLKNAIKEIEIERRNELLRQAAESDAQIKK